jgi:predicted nucleic acid-binding protein
MKYLLDAKVVLRIVEIGHAMHAAALGGTSSLLKQGHELYLVPQVLYEFWVVCTRPTVDNGLGFSTIRAAVELGKVLAQFPLLDDTADVFPAWRQLVTSFNVAGKGAHDARLVAAMNVHGLTHILTFNFADFQRYPTINAESPDQVIQPTRLTP